MFARDDIDVAYVMTPSGVHAQVAIDAARAGKNVVTTKPIEVTLEKADAMMNEYLQIEAEALRSKHVMVKKFREKLPGIRVHQYFVLEELLEAGFFSQIAENLPEIK